MALLPHEEDFWRTHQRGLHPPEQCQGRTCVVHNPSNHRLRNAQLYIVTGGPVWRYCTHMVYHPDPDSYAYYLATDPEGDHVRAFKNHYDRAHIRGYCYPNDCCKTGSKLHEALT